MKWLPSRQAADLTVVVFTVGEPTFEQCLKSIENQTLRPAAIEIVRNVSPMPRAFQQGLELVKTEFYASVDADIILRPRALATIYRHIKRDDRVYEAIAPLNDPLLGRIYGVRIYRTGVIRQLGGFPMKRGPERLIGQAAVAAGYRSIMLKTVVGAHHPTYTPQEAYNKFFEISLRIRKFSGRESWQQHVKLLSEAWLRDRDSVKLFGLAGLMDGLNAPQEQVEPAQGMDCYRASERFEQLRAFLLPDQA